jgi:hypothetical protein
LYREQTTHSRVAVPAPGWLDFRRRCASASISGDQFGASIASLKRHDGNRYRVTDVERVAQLGWAFHPDADQAVVTETAGCSGQ